MIPKTWWNFPADGSWPQVIEPKLNDIESLDDLEAVAWLHPNPATAHCAQLVLDDIERYQDDHLYD